MTDPKLEKLRLALKNMRQQKSILQDRVDDRLRPGFQYLPASLDMHRMTADDLDVKKQNLARCIADISDARRSTR